MILAVAKADSAMLVILRKEQGHLTYMNISVTNSSVILYIRYEITVNVDLSYISICHPHHLLNVKR